jgi:hypothetical protein
LLQRGEVLAGQQASRSLKMPDEKNLPTALDRTNIRHSAARKAIQLQRPSRHPFPPVLSAVLVPEVFYVRLDTRGHCTLVSRLYRLVVQYAARIVCIFFSCQQRASKRRTELMFILSKFSGWRSSDPRRIPEWSSILSTERRGPL